MYARWLYQLSIKTLTNVTVTITMYYPPWLESCLMISPFMENMFIAPETAVSVIWLHTASQRSWGPQVPRGTATEIVLVSDKNVNLWYAYYLREISLHVGSENEQWDGVCNVDNITRWKVIIWEWCLAYDKIRQIYQNKREERGGAGLPVMDRRRQGKIFSVLVLKPFSITVHSMEYWNWAGVMEQGLLKKIRLAVDTRYPVIFPIEDDGEDGVDQISSSTSLTLCQYATKDFFFAAPSGMAENSESKMWQSLHNMADTHYFMSHRFWVKNQIRHPFRYALFWHYSSASFRFYGAFFQLWQDLRPSSFGY